MTNYKKKLPNVWKSGREVAVALYRNSSPYRVLAEVKESLSLHDVIRFPGMREPRRYDLGYVASAVKRIQVQMSMRKGIVFGYISHDYRDCALENLGSVLLPALSARIDADGLKIIPHIPACRTISITLRNGIVRHHQQILDTETGRTVLLLMAQSKPDEWGWSWNAQGWCIDGEDGTKTYCAGAIVGFDWVFNPAFPSLWQAELLRKKGVPHTTYQLPTTDVKKILREARLGKQLVI